MRILYIDVDTLRADHTGPYGYTRPTTPNLDRLAERGVVFDHYYASDSPCLPSRTALTSGQFGITNGVVGHTGEAARFRLDTGHGIPEERPLLGQHLQRHGYYTASISMFAERHRAYFFLGNFRESIRATDRLTDETAEEIHEVAFDWLRRRGTEDHWFLHLNYWDPHTDYLQSADWTQRAAESGPAPAWPDQETISSHQEIYGPRTAVDLHYAFGPRRSPVPDNMPDAIAERTDFEHLINGYDGAIMYWDHHFGRLLDLLDELGIADDTAVIVSADHGESFGELGSYAEHGLANEAVHRLPLVVSWPGLTDRIPEHARHNDALLYNIDLGPTLCDLLDIAAPSGWQGESFATGVRGEPLVSRDYLVLGQGAHTYQRSVRTRDHLYTCTYHPGAFRAEGEQLFDITADPHQTRDLSATEPELMDRMRSLLAQWWTFYAGRPGALPDPMLTALQEGPTLYTDPEAYAEHLRATGRAHLADDLERLLATAAGTVPVSWHPSTPGRLGIGAFAAPGQRAPIHPGPEHLS